MEVIEFDFNWSERIDGHHVFDSDGNEIGLTTKAPPPRRKKNKTRNFKDTKAGKGMKQNKCYRFTGVNHAGKYVYTAFSDTFVGCEEQIKAIRKTQRWRHAND